MKAMISITGLREVIYFNCMYCGRPIFLDNERRLGWCGCRIDGVANALHEPAERRVGSEALAFDDSDPYGQIIQRAEA